MTGMMAGPDGTATPMDPMMMGDGDVLGDGILGDPQQGANNPDLNTNAMEMQGEMEIRNDLVTKAYGTKLPSRRTIDRD